MGTAGGLQLDNQIASIFDSKIAIYDGAKYAPQTAPPPGRVTSTSTVPDEWAFKQLSASFFLGKDEAHQKPATRAKVGPISHGPYLNRLRDEIGRWHGDPLERN